MTNRLKITIITISLNAEKYIEHAILSVLSQTYNNIEYIVIDGQSTDLTVEIIEKYSSKITHFVSEKDQGIADAMNKGLSCASGDYILFLHPDDFLLSNDSIEKAVQFIDFNNDIVAFTILLEHRNSRIPTKPRGFTPWFLFKTGIFHQSCFCKSTLFAQIGKFNTKLKIEMDYDFFLRAYNYGSKTKVVDYPLAIMRQVGVSSKKDWESLKERFLEEKYIHYSHCNSNWLRICYKVYWSLYVPYRRLLLYTK